MRYGAIIVDNRNLNFDEIIERHKKFLPDYFKIRHVKTQQNHPFNYNELITLRGFWIECPFDKVLIFQHDSGLLRTGIEEFLEYDFIGAPLYHIPFPCMNGGLSLRSRDAMIKCIEDTPYDPKIHGNEDIYFCNQIKKLGGNLPTKEIASKFSVETIYGLGSMGYHAIDKWHSKEKCETILNQYK